MFCPTCGTEVPEGSAFCPTCGTKIAAATTKVEKDEFFEDVRPAQTAQPVRPAAQTAQPDKLTGTNTLAVVGFILAFFASLPALICSIMGLKKSKEYVGENGRGLAIAGIVLSSISLAVTVIVCSIYGIVFIVAFLEGITTAPY